MPSRRTQIEMTPDEVRAFLAESRTMNVATYNHDGSIHLVAMWYGMEGDAPVFWTYGRSQKIKNLERDPRITALVETGDSYDQLRGVELVGRGEVVTDRAAVMAVGAKVYDKYFGEVNDESQPILEQIGAKRHAVRIAVERIVSWDHTKLGGVY